VDFFTASNGRVSGVLRVPKKNSSVLQPFQLVQISWTGNKDLKTIVTCESDHQKPLKLVDKTLFCGFYLNEILQRVLPLDDIYASLFVVYEKTLQALSIALSSTDIESVLRKFEFSLLSEIGFELNFNSCALTGKSIKDDCFYQFKMGVGFTLINAEVLAPTNSSLISGSDLLAIAHSNYSQPSTLKAAKQITRQALPFFLGSKPLKSRELFV
jgi:DNA repair protein RecO (recombination protein O)